MADDGSGALRQGPHDLRVLLAPYASSRVTLAAPGTPVLLEPAAAAELAAAVGAALDNVRTHAGEQAHAWILVEDEVDAVLVSVRDDGPGIAEGRLAAAEVEGRLGVAQSIRGRLRDLGGSAELVSVPGQGAEVELRLPKPRPGRRTKPRPDAEPDAEPGSEDQFGAAPASRPGDQAPAPVASAVFSRNKGESAT